MSLNYLIAKRKELNLSQKDVALHLNITQQHYSRIEKGLIDYTPYINKLSKHLKCNKKDLLSNLNINKDNNILKDFSRTEDIHFRVEKPDSVYVNLKGWFKKNELNNKNIEDVKTLPIKNLFQGMFSKLFENKFIKSTSFFDFNKKEKSSYDLVLDILKSKGETSALIYSEQLFDRIDKFDNKQLLVFFNSLAIDFDLEKNHLLQAVKAYHKDNSEKNYEKMISIFSSKRIDLFRKLNFTNNGTIGLVNLRSRLLPLIKNNNLFKKIDVDLSNLFKSWFNRGFLITNPITWNTSAKVLEKIIKYEAVHQIKSWDDLRSRLEPIDRKCYGFFHPTMYDEPLIFVEVALMEEVPSNIFSILNPKRKHVISKNFTTAVFYSISNCQKGLKGISFGNFLIKQVVIELKKEFPYLKTFVTLSPVPKFSKWLKEKDIKFTKKLTNYSSIKRNEKEILAYAKEYFFKAKQNDNYPIDPVQRFHLSNGAILENINLNADLSENGIKNSLGLMVNYKYELNSIEKNHEEYFSKMSIPASKKLK